MKATVTVVYEGGIRLDLDEALRSTAQAVHAVTLGSGAELAAPYKRDLSWQFRTKGRAQSYAKYVRSMMKLLHIPVEVTVT